MRLLRKMTWVELKLFLREPLTVVFTLAFPLIVLVILGGVFGNTPGQTDDETGELVWRGAGPMDYYVPSYLALVVAAVGLVGLPPHLAAYRERGVLRRFRASSMSPSALFGAQALVTAVVATAGSLLLIVVAMLGYGVHRPASSGLVLGAFVLTVGEFAALGVLLGVLLPTARAAQGAGVLVWFGMMFLAGAGPPPEVLAGWMRTAADFTPLYHASVLLQDAWLGFGWNWVEAAIVAGVMVVSALLSVRFFRWD
jgi:ABC-2 type transport system permease protein